MITKEQKKKILDDLKTRITKVKAIVFTDYQGLKVTEMQELRKQLRVKQIGYEVIKTTLIRKGLEDAGIKIDEKIYKKPVALAFSEGDEVEPNKIIFNFSKINEKLKILGAVIGNEFIEVDKVKVLATMPSRDELYAKVVGSISAPLSGLVNVLGGNLRGLVSVLKQYQESKSQ